MPTKPKHISHHNFNFQLARALKRQKAITRIKPFLNKTLLSTWALKRLTVKDRKTTR
jgi:hypothetical protein